mgnify:FL=1
MKSALQPSALNQLFHHARSYNSWHSEQISPETLRAVWDLARMGPTSANCSPMRVVFVVSPEAKEKLRPCLMEDNVDKVMTAPATAVLGYDMAFPDRLPELFPHTDARSWFVGNDELIATTAFRNSTLQGAFLMMAARALGLDCGPMSGFDNGAVDAAFFAGTQVKSNFICGLGHGDDASVFERSPRLSFDDACRVA